MRVTALILFMIGAFHFYSNAIIPDKNYSFIGTTRYMTNDSAILVKGRIMTEKGEPLAGASVSIKGTAKGTATDENGHFLLKAERGSLLIISFIGYKDEIISVKDEATLNIILHESALFLDDVIVTALGIQKKQRSLTYAVDEISKDELIRVKDPNLIVTLMGKIAGVQINKSSSGTGGSAKVNIRGMRSVAGNNQPLYVIDGVPMLNNSSTQAYTAIGGIADAGNRDGGDGISNLNPEDIASISILKGAPASALYGTQAANGVILITTKHGETGKQEINFSTHFTFDKAILLPRFQNSYGASDGTESWGDRTEMPCYNNAREFFNTGTTLISSLTIASGKNQMQHYFSYANTTGKGIIPGNRLSKHNFNIRVVNELFKGRIQLNGNINLMRQDIKNRPVPGGFYMNPLIGLYRFPRGMDIRPYREQFEVRNEKRNMMEQNWHSSTEDFEQNPYWVINRILNKDQRTRILASLAAKINFTPDIYIQARGTIDYIYDVFREKFFASTAPSLCGLNGRYIQSDYRQTLLYGDVIANMQKKKNNFSLNLSVGASINDDMVNALRYDSKTASLKYANVFTIANINMNTSAYIEEQQNAHKQRQSAFASMQIGYLESIYLDISARNDWSSTLAYTQHEKSGFFYSSVGLAWIAHQMLKFPEWVSFGKIRATWSKVGNDIPIYITHPVAHIKAGGSIQSADAAPFEDMKPEINTSFEVGTEWRLCDNRLNVNLTYYNNHTRNQFFKLPAQEGDIYAYRYVNAGDIRNRGIELAIEGDVINKHAGLWKTTINYSHNRNKVIRLHNQLPVFTYGPSGFSSTYAMKLIKGGSFGDLYGKAFKRDEGGHILYETEGEKKGLPQIEGSGNIIKVGSANPKFNISWSHRLNWKGFSVYMLFDGRFGGNVLSHTQADMDLFGVTYETGKARDRGYVELEGQKIRDVKKFYKLIVGGRAGTTEYYIYDATNIRLREFAFGYTIPKSWLSKTNIITNIQLSLTARNLFFLYKKAPFDPDLVLSTGNDNQAIDSYGMPTTRSIGFNIRFTF